MLDKINNIWELQAKIMDRFSEIDENDRYGNDVIQEYAIDCMRELDSLKEAIKDLEIKE